MFHPLPALTTALLASLGAIVVTTELGAVVRIKLFQSIRLPAQRSEKYITNPLKDRVVGDLSDKTTNAMPRFS